MDVLHKVGYIDKVVERLKDKALYIEVADAASAHDQHKSGRP